MNRRRLFIRGSLALWVIVWVFFLVRPVAKGLLNEYKDLLFLSSEGKRSYMTGASLYEFVQFCNRSVGVQKRYEIVGLDRSSLDYRRAVYYLYPNVVSDRDPEFIFVFGTPGFKKEGYAMFRSMDNGRYILTRQTHRGV